MQDLSLIADAQAASALLKPPRPALLELLREPDSAAGAARKLGMARQKVAYHVRELERHGLLKAVGERRVRNCVERIVQATARRYVLAPASLGALAPDPGEIEDRFSSAYQVASASRLAEQVAHLRQEAAREGLKLPTLTLQGTAWVDSPAAQAELAEALQQAFTGIVKRYARHADDRRQRPFDLTTFLHPGTDPKETEE